MSTLLDKNASILVTTNDQHREIPGGGLFIRQESSEQDGSTSELPAETDELVDLGDYILLPELINTHHHFYQTLARVVPAAQHLVIN